MSVHSVTSRTLLEILRAVCVHLKHSSAPSLGQGIDHVTGLLRAVSPEISEVKNQNGSRDGTMDSRSFPITSSFIRSCSLCIAVMKYDVYMMYDCDIGINPAVLTEPKPPSECDEYFSKDLGKKIVFSTGSIIVPGHLVSVSDR